MTATRAKKTAPSSGKARNARQNRREELLTKAAELFARHGFEGTSMRDIASAVDMLPGSLYYHFASKEELLLTIHDRVVGDMRARVEQAIEGHADPWDRLELAAIAHLEGLLAEGSVVTIISPNFPGTRSDLYELLKGDRNRYEALFRDLFSALEVNAGTDRRLLRLQLLGALNWVPVWYDPAVGSEPAEIARSFVRSIRDGCRPRS